MPIVDTFRDLTVEVGDEGEGFLDNIFGTAKDVLLQTAQEIGRAASERAADEIRGVTQKINPNQGTPSNTQTSLGNRFASTVAGAGNSIDTNTILLFGGGALALITVALFATRR
jgi:hypothetical protein